MNGTDMNSMNHDTLLALWRRMTCIRSFEERASADKLADRLEGYIHNYSGQEAVAVGIIPQLRDDDWLTSTYRNHGHSIARDVPLEAMTGELLGRATGVCGGKGGSMHAVDQDRGMIGGMGIVAAGLPIAAGAALAARRHGEDRVAVTFFGDGAVHQGAFHEAMTFASLFDCPVLFVCENNLYAETTAVDYHLIAGSVVAMAEPYGIRATRVDGMDLFAVREVAAELIERARQTGKPALLEAMTYRYGGQYEGDTQTYKPPDEVDHWRAQDPLLRFRADVTSAGLVTAAELDRVAAESAAAVGDAFVAAQAAPWPDPDQLLADVYTEL